MSKWKSIRTKLIAIFVVVAALVYVVNIYIYYNQSKAIQKIDGVYNNNIQLNDMVELLDGMQDALFQYLNTKSSDELEKYYSFEQDYRNMLAELNTQTVSDPELLMEKNIYNISMTYMEEAEKAIGAKRGRNVSRYNECYGNAEKVYKFLKISINRQNTAVFLKNSYSYSGMRKILNYMVWISEALLLAVMLVALLWLVVMTGNITRPLIKLANVAEEIALGNMEVGFPITETNDEISTVAKACNKMMESIRVYIQKTKENYERESRMVENELIMKNDLKEAQLKYLQAQINPHFLFNSLNAGAQLAMMEGAEKACIFIENMADFFRYNVRKMDKDTTLEEELKLVDHYIYILNVRFSGEIHYHKRIDERLASVVMPSMILQPIVENAVNHGIRGMDGLGEIRVGVFGEKDDVCIKVEDNGVGIDPEKAKRIVKGEKVRSDSHRDSAGIGMDNIISRLRYYYGREHVIEIRRKDEGGGTEVTLYIPQKREGQNENASIDL